MSDPILAAWEEYHGEPSVCQWSGEEYIPQMPPAFRRGFMDGVEWEMDRQKDYHDGVRGLKESQIKYMVEGILRDYTGLTINASDQQIMTDQLRTRLVREMREML